MCVQVHVNICQEIGAQLDKESFCKRVTESMVTSSETKVNILWNEQVQTDRTIRNNKLAVIICDNVRGTCLSVANKISGNRNLNKKTSQMF